MCSPKVIQAANWASFVILGLVDALLGFVIPPFKRGFFCDDDGIKYPFVQKETVPTWAVIVVSFVSPVILVVICEIGRHWRGSKFQTDDLQDRRERATCNGVYTKWPLFHRLCKIIFVFLFGSLLNLLFTNFGKVYVGHLRPHFLAVCKPNMALVNCSEGYVTNYDCTGGDASAIQNARKSFPSGHSSCSMYAMVFLALYFQALMSKDRGTSFLKPFIQFGFILLSVFIGLSRISDHVHSWSDVLAGFLLGAFMAVYIVFKVLKLFKSSQGMSRTAAAQRNLSSSEPLHIGDGQGL